MDQNDFKKLQDAYTLRGIELAQLHERVTSLEEEIAHLKEQLRLQQERLFGKKSETSHNLASTAAPKTTPVASHVRTIPPRGHRQLDTSSLPKYTMLHDLSDREKACLHCGGALHEIGPEISEQLEIIPVQYCIIEHVRLKYGCRSCDSIIMAPKTPAPLPKCIAGASLLTDVALSKYQYHLPLYRQSKIMQSCGITISDKTLGNWVMGTGDALSKIYEALWIILKQRYLQVDETPVKVLETNKKGYIWAYFAPNNGKGLVAFEFSLTREGCVATERLKTFNGLLQTDGYKGYEALRQREGIVGFGCLSHARRKFSEVVKISGNKEGIAAEMIERMKPLYALEARLRDVNAHHRTRKRLRQKMAAPLLKEIHHWLRSIENKVLPKSKLGASYCLYTEAMALFSCLFTPWYG